MIEFSVKPNITIRRFGGDTLNTAVYMSRLLNQDEFEVHYVTAVGTDSFSAEMCKEWKNENIHTDLVQQIKDKLPGLYTIFTDEKGERSFYYWRNASAARDWLKTENTAAVCVALYQFDYIYLSGISLAILDAECLDKLGFVLAKAKAAGAKIIFDNNYRPVLWSEVAQAQEAYRNVLTLTDMALLTLDDEEMLWGDGCYKHAIERTQGFGVKEVVIKRGSKSCIVAVGDDIVTVPTNKLDKSAVIDTTAAGDSFGAGYIAKRLMRGSAEEAAKQGHRLAGTVIQHQGAIIPRDVMPN